MSGKTGEARELKNTPIELLDYLPAKRWRLTIGALLASCIVLASFLGFMANRYFVSRRMLTELNAYEKLWNSQGIPSYLYTVSWLSSNASHPHLTVSVEDGLPTKQAGELPPDVLNTVPDLFADARNTIRQASVTIHQVWAEVSYDPTFGYPTHIGFTYHDFTYVGGSYDISHFTPLHQYSKLQAELDKNAALWDTSSISNYTFGIKAWTGDSYSEMSVLVQDGVSSISISRETLPADVRALDSVPNLFNRIQKAITDREESGFNALDIQYDPQAGFPNYIALRDPTKSFDPTTSGDPGTFVYAIVDFKVLK